MQLSPPAALPNSCYPEQYLLRTLSGKETAREETAMSQTTNGIDSREKVLLAANVLFVRSGYSGASMNMIAQEAGINKSLIYHHFSSKEELWNEVLFQHTDKFVQRQIALFNKISVFSKELMIQVIYNIFEHFSHNPDSARIFLWANLETHNTTPLDLSSSERWIYFQSMIDTLKKGQQSGTLRKDIPASHMLIALLGMTSYWFMMNKNLKELTSGQEHSPVDDKSYLESFITLFFDGASAL